MYTQTLKHKIKQLNLLKIIILLKPHQRDFAMPNVHQLL